MALNNNHIVIMAGGIGSRLAYEYPPDAEAVY